MMPRITGYEWAKIREKFTHFELPIIMLTAKNRIEDIVKSESGANDYLPKLRWKELMARVDNLLLLNAESIKLQTLNMNWKSRHIQLSTMSSVVPELDTKIASVAYQWNGSAVISTRSTSCRQQHRNISMTDTEYLQRL